MHKINNSLLILSLVAASLFAGENPYLPLRTMCDSIFGRIPDSLKNSRIVILPFTNNSRLKDNTFSMAISAYIIDNIGRYGNLELVEPEEFQKALDDAYLTQADVFTWNKAVKIGSKLSAPLVLGGDFSDNFSFVKIKSNLLHTDSKNIISSDTANLEPSKLERLSQEMFSGRNEVRASFIRSLALPGLGQIHSLQYVRGGISMGLGIGAVGYLAFSVARMVKAKNDLDEHMENYGKDISNIDDYNKWQAHYEELDKDHDDKKLYATIGGAITAGVWSLNLLDAAIAGYQKEKRYRPYFQMSLTRKTEIGIACRF